MEITDVMEVPDRAAVLLLRDKTEQDLQDCKQIIREWLQKQPHLPEIKDRKLELFILSCKFRLEKVKKVLDTHYTIRNLLPEVFDNFDPLSDQIQFDLKTRGFVPLPKMLPGYGRVYFVTNPPEVNENDDPWSAIRIIYMITEIMLAGEFADSQHYVFDLHNSKFSTKYTPSALKKMFILGRDAYCARIESLHFVNSPPSLDIVIGILKTLASEKIFGRIHVHKNLQSLHEHIPKSVLPKEYGGDEISFNEIKDKWTQKLIANREFLMSEVKLRTDESKRVQEGGNEDVFGSIHGTFKQLSID